MLALLLALGALAALASSASSSEDDSTAWSPSPGSEPSPGPVCALNSSPGPEPTSARPSAWRDYFTAGGCKAAPVEAPKNDTDVAESEDLDALPIAGAVSAPSVYRALYLLTDPGELLIFAERVEEGGFKFAANRLRQKAFRYIR